MTITQLIHNNTLKVFPVAIDHCLLQFFDSIGYLRFIFALRIYSGCYCQENDTCKKNVLYHAMLFLKFIEYIWNYFKGSQVPKTLFKVNLFASSSVSCLDHAILFDGSTEAP